MIKQTIDVKEVYNLCVLSSLKQNDIDSSISVSKIKGIKTTIDKQKA